MRRVLLFLAVLVLTSTSLQGQWLGTLSLDNGYDDNMFRNYAGASSASTDISLMYGYFPEDGNWAVNYSGALTTFSEYPERLYALQSMAASYVMKYGDGDANSLTVIGNGSLRIDRDDYVLYDYSQAMGSLSWRHQLVGDLPLMLTYHARYRSYPNFGELSYLEHFASIGTMMFFETRTSLRIQAEYGFKNYSQNAFSNTLGASTVLHGAAAESAGLTLSGGGPGSGGPGSGGPGSGGDGGGGDGGGGPGSGGDGDGSSSGSGEGYGGGSGRMGLNTGGRRGGMESTVEYLVFEEPSTSQLRAWVNIGQSLGETTGLSVRFLQRWNLTDRGRAFVGGAVDFIGEEELFDDPYSYESSELSFTLTQVLNWGMRLRGGGFYIAKSYDYPSTLDYSDPNVESRQDDRIGGWLRIEKRFGGDWLLFNGLRLSLGYVHMRNRSNTSYYDYNSNALSLGMSTDF
ncbi:MAG: hypothetical protein RRA94_03820 [Bacteroidota bacterium]|nr:hypothetical protein [Bacteroidota bacterium]